MTTKTVESNNGKLVIVASDEVIISDGQSALDFVASMVYEHDCYGIAVNKAAVAEDFFVLSTGVAGEVVQKFVNYRMIVPVGKTHEVQSLRLITKTCGKIIDEELLLVRFVPMMK